MVQPLLCAFGLSGKDHHQIDGDRYQGKYEDDEIIDVLRRPLDGTQLYHSAQSAMKISVSRGFCGLRFEAKASFLPSGENMGKLSKLLL